MRLATPLVYASSGCGREKMVMMPCELKAILLPTAAVTFAPAAMLQRVGALLPAAALPPAAVLIHVAGCWCSVAKRCPVTGSWPAGIATAFRALVRGH